MGVSTAPTTEVELHGFLSYLIKCSNVERRTYKMFGYRGKQVRENIHAFDVARFIDAFSKNPRCGEVYTKSLNDIFTEIYQAAVATH